MGALLYFVSLALFGFVIFACVRMPNDIWLVLSIFPSFIALILGLVMAIFAWGEFGPVVSVGSLIPGFVIVQFTYAKLSARQLFLAICVALAVGLICARVAFVAVGIG